MALTRDEHIAEAELIIVLHPDATAEDIGRLRDSLATAWGSA